MTDTSTFLGIYTDAINDAGETAENALEKFGLQDKSDVMWDMIRDMISP